MDKSKLSLVPSSDIQRGLTIFEVLVNESSGTDICARCLERHNSLDWELFTNYSTDGKVVVPGYAICPNTNEPIVFIIIVQD